MITVTALDEEFRPVASSPARSTEEAETLTRSAFAHLSSVARVELVCASVPGDVAWLTVVCRGELDWTSERG